MAGARLFPPLSGGGGEVGGRGCAPSLSPVLSVGICSCFIMQKPLTREFSIVPSQAALVREQGADVQQSS